MHRFLSLCLLLLIILPLHARDSEGWPLVEDCAEAVDVEAVPPFIEDYPGVILAYQPGEGVRALRSEIGQPYYVAFDGSNFTAAAGVSPDGAYIALPYGTIQTLGTSDIIYSANELRVYTTGRVPDIRRRVAWTASFPYQGLDGSDAIPRLRWLDKETILYVQGSARDGYTAYTLTPFADDPTPLESDLGGYRSLSPDLTRGIGPEGDGWGLFDLDDPDSSEALAAFEAHPMPLTRFVWSPDSTQFATVIVDGEGRQLALYDREGAVVDLFLSYTNEESLWNVRWSPDGAQLAFSLYDPQRGLNRLHVADIAAREVRDLCVTLYPLHDGGLNGMDPAGLVWSPDGAQMAVNIAGSDVPLQILDFAANARYPITGYMGGLLSWGSAE